jgi:2-oxoglutarate dehydrogenase E1 component
MKSSWNNSYLFGGNAAFIDQLYADYLKDPAAIEPSWRQYFDELQGSAGETDVDHVTIRNSLSELVQAPPSRRNEIDINAVVQKQIAVLQLISAYRSRGFQVANLDPLGRSQRADAPELELAYYGFTDADMETLFKTGSLAGPDIAPLREIYRILRETYCGTIGAEYMHMTSTEQKRWVQERLERIAARPNLSAAQKQAVLERLTAAETLEKYLHTRYVGQKRFSLQGSESLIPLLDELIQRAGAQKIEEMCIGMAHRGRLNVLVNTLGKQPCDLFREFEGAYSDDLPSGDVKYHKGFSTDLSTAGGPLHVSLAFNPSHLEIVNPVIEGSVRARQQRRADLKGDRVIPVLIHGDAAFAGQGVVMETLNMSRTRGYRTGGTVHIIINNQIGFTTSDPRDTRSTVHCTDVAKMIDAPIFHVNGDDPESVLLVTQLALDFRMAFHTDVVVDLICFRKLGHNEGDEPLVTQPLMYKQIAKHPGTRGLYADRLVAEGVIGPEVPEQMIADYRAALDACALVSKPVLSNYKRSFSSNWDHYKNSPAETLVDTSVPLADLKRLGKQLTTIPANFKLHPRVEKIIAERRLMSEGKQPLDWGMAENMAYASLLMNGYGVRLSGQDSGRGTFFHRHAVLHDQNREKWDSGAYIPLQNLSPEQPHFLVIDSFLSEEAVLGFEYGYAVTEPEHLVIWEAQFGDFANGAQVVIDQFISSGEAKWGRMCHLVMMLPHGFEGQGPEHSSARLERYLQLCADRNIQVVVPSTPAQMFHLLRRQMLRRVRKPLIIMSPKSLLRHKESVSSLDELAHGQFQPVIGEMELKQDAGVTRVLACSGKVYYDLLAERRARGIDDIAIVRIEELYPFPAELFAAELKRYPNARELYWVQEEPQNQGAWYQIQHQLRLAMRDDQVLRYAGRPSSASPAVGYAAKHAQQQRDLVNEALTVSEIQEKRRTKHAR